jgi:hypothetical protein
VYRCVNSIVEVCRRLQLRHSCCPHQDPPCRRRIALRVGPRFSTSRQSGRRFNERLNKRLNPKVSLSNLLPFPRSQYLSRFHTVANKIQNRLPLKLTFRVSALLARQGCRQTPISRVMSLFSRALILCYNIALPSINSFLLHSCSKYFLQSYC